MVPILSRKALELRQNLSNRKVICYAALAAAVTIPIYKLGAYYQNRRQLATDSKNASDILNLVDSNIDEVADDLLEIPVTDVAPPMSTSPTHPASTSNAGSPTPTLGPQPCPSVDATTSVVPPPEQEPDCGEPDNKRSRPRTRAPYAKFLFDMTRARFGVPNDTDANRMVMRRFLHDYMERRRNRPYTISTTIPIVMEMTFVPTQQDLELKRAIAHPSIVSRKRYNQSPSIFEQIKLAITRVFTNTLGDSTILPPEVV